MNQIDLTFPAEGFEEGLLFGVVVTQYSDGEIFIRGYDVDTTNPGGEQVTSSAELTPETAALLRDWLNEVL